MPHNHIIVNVVDEMTKHVLLAMPKDADAQQLKPWHTLVLHTQQNLQDNLCGAPKSVWAHWFATFTIHTWHKKATMLSLQQRRHNLNALSPSQ